MRLKIINGTLILLCLILLTGTALAADYSAVLDTCNEAGGENIQYLWRDALWGIAGKSL